MTIKPKIFIAVTALTGGCVGLPLYLLSSHSSLNSSGQPIVKVTVSETRTPVVVESSEKNSVAKGTCEIKELSQEIKNYLGEKYKEGGDSVPLSCTNTNVKSDYTQLPVSWAGLFPKFVFSNESTIANGQTIEVYTQIQQGESDHGSITEVTFSGSGLKSTFDGEWDEKTQTQLPNTAVTVQVSGEDRKSGTIYLFLPKLERTDSET